LNKSRFDPFGCATSLSKRAKPAPLPDRDAALIALLSYAQLTRAIQRETAAYRAADRN
jgi:hypothetical protein